MFTFLLAYILNKPVYVLDLSMNQWREYDLTNTDLEFHSNFVQEYKPLNPFGPPFMIAEHIEMENGEKLGTHVAPIIHEEFDDGSRNGRFLKMPFKIYIKVRIFSKFFISDQWITILVMMTETKRMRL